MHPFMPNRICPKSAVSADLAEFSLAVIGESDLGKVACPGCRIIDNFIGNWNDHMQNADLWLYHNCSLLLDSTPNLFVSKARFGNNYSPQ